MNEDGLPEGTVAAEHLGVRVFCISASDAQQLADQLALVLGEHMASNDEMHLTYNAIQSGWQHDPGRPGWLGRSPHTQLYFEYTALLVLRSTGGTTPLISGVKTTVATGRSIQFPRLLLHGGSRTAPTAAF